MNLADYSDYGTGADTLKTSSLASSGMYVTGNSNSIYRQAFVPSYSIEDGHSSWQNVTGTNNASNALIVKVDGAPPDTVVAKV